MNRIILIENEMKLLCDASNGKVFELGNGALWQQNTINDWSESNSVNDLDAKWGVNFRELESKLVEATPVQFLMILCDIESYGLHPDSDFTEKYQSLGKPSPIDVLKTVATEEEFNICMEMLEADKIIKHTNSLLGYHFNNVKIAIANNTLINGGHEASPLEIYNFQKDQWINGLTNKFADFKNTEVVNETMIAVRRIENRYNSNIDDLLGNN